MREPQGRDPLGRSVSLDVLRGIAVLLTIGAHQRVDNFTGLAGWLAQSWHDHGALGVPLFFLLSGYLIGGLMLDEHRRTSAFDIRRFLIRRGFKLYPAYFVFLVYLIAMPTLKAALSGQAPGATFASMLDKLLPNFVFLQNYIGSNPAAHTWSLAVEEHFYLMLPLLMIVLVATGRTRDLLFVGLASPLVFTGVRYVSWKMGDPNFSSLSPSMATHLRLDELAMGVGLRALKEYSPHQFARLRGARWLAIAAGSALLLNWHSVLPTLSIGAGLILTGAIHLSAGEFGHAFAVLRWPVRLLAWIGVHSYSIYLWHVTLLGIMAEKLLEPLALDRTATGPWFVHRILLCAGIVLGGWALAKLVEQPALRLRDRWFPALRPKDPPPQRTLLPRAP